ncbi:serine/threonine-protein kinase ZRK1-like [Telopea speciosissima]|uniref:serine/threonine-protein kinase ZRK1-like n=1 Tax=Telopea speciosissima TaxID=54955 RepID=UPI001CC47A44|nr:serine/threonine-protein kinase ZRK1-like [Telopea speciosissima]
MELKLFVALLVNFVLFVSSGALEVGRKAEEVKKHESPIPSFHDQRFLYHTHKVSVCASVFDQYAAVLESFEGQGKRYWLGESIREVVIASQLNHSNVLKLLGCCFKFPILVYEFAYNRVLFDQIHGKEDDSSTRTYTLLSWETRLKITTEIANAVTCVQMATSEVIVHRDVRPSNVFLDHKWVSKLSDFTSSISIPSSETHVEVDGVRGTPGFIDPESICLNHLIKKRGMINQQQLQASMELARRCTREKAEERPAMIKVAKELK